VTIGLFSSFSVNMLW